MKMKATGLLAAVLALVLLAGCAAQGGGKSGDKADPADFKTLGDVAEFEEIGYTCSEEVYACAFEANGVCYRVDAKMTPEVYAALDALDFLGDDYEEKAKEILAPLEIFSVTNLSEGIPTKDELKALVGKTGQALLDDGWTVWGWDLETLEYRMYHDVYTFTVLFEGDAEVTEDTDGEEILPQLVVKSVTYDGIGRATEID